MPLLHFLFIRLHHIWSLIHRNLLLVVFHTTLLYFTVIMSGIVLLSNKSEEARIIISYSWSEGSHPETVVPLVLLR